MLAQWGVRICQPSSKTSILAVEGLKNLKSGTPPSTRSTKKKRAPPSTGVQICHLTSKMNILAVEGLKKSKLATPPSTGSTTKISVTQHGSANVDFLNTLREIRVTILNPHPLEVLANKAPQSERRCSMHGHRAKRVSSH